MFPSVMKLTYSEWSKSVLTMAFCCLLLLDNTSFAVMLSVHFSITAINQSDRKILPKYCLNHFFRFHCSAMDLIRGSGNQLSFLVAKSDADTIAKISNSAC